MNTVGKKGRLGEQIRCVVSVSMLTEGWDTNTVTHILGVRAFGTQLLCEQVVGRGLRRQSYELNDEGPVRRRIRRHHGHPVQLHRQAGGREVPSRRRPSAGAGAEGARGLEIRFPRVEGYRVELPEERLRASFRQTRGSAQPENVGPCTVLMEGIVGEGVELNPEVLESVRPSTVSFTSPNG